MTTYIPDNRRFTARDGLWFSLALLLHAAVFLLPLRYGHEPVPVQEYITIALVSPAKIPPEVMESPPQIDPLPEREPEPLAPPLREVSQQPQKQQETRDQPAEPPEPDISVITAAQLVHSASRFEWSQPANDERFQLGVFTARPPPANWNSGPEEEENLFDGMTLPVRTQVVDRWLAADGSHNVVINTPGGDTMCGRAQAWSPMNPLMEHVMMWRPCGGGGKRTFEMPHRGRASTEIRP